MFSTSNEGNVSIWGLVIFFLILFWVFGAGNGFGRPYGHDYGWNGCPGGQTDRDVLQLGTAAVTQNAATQNMLKDLAFQQERSTAAILEGQKDLYIRDLERVATQQFITSQTDTLSSKMDNIAAAGALQRQSDMAAIQAQIAAIQCQMLKAPQPIPIVGLNTIGCSNAGSTNFGCGC